jgi:tRNA threonylcarbamoyladenosine biosynthesis protein TsaE
MLYHLDLYRIDNSDAALAFGVDEFLYDKNAYCLLEWPERISDILPPETIRITIEHIAEDCRRLTLPSDMEIQD